MRDMILQCLEIMRDQLREEVTPRRGTANRHKGERNMISLIIGYLSVCDKHGQGTANRHKGKRNLIS